MTDTRLRRAVDSDVPAIGALMRRSFQKYVDRIGKPPAPMTADYHQVVRESRVWVLESQDDDGRLLGVLVTDDRGDHLLLDTMAVDPEAQGGGLGTQLLDRADRDARALALPEIRLYTNEKMTENLAFYPRHGYTETARLRQDGFDRVFFTKPATP